MGFLSFIGKIFGLGRRFNGTPEQYLGMVQYMAAKNNPQFTPTELLQFGEVFQKVMKVNLHPYKDFQDLAVNGVPDFLLVNKVDDKVKELEHRRDLKQALYGTDADLGDDDVMKSNDASAVYARKLVKDLSQHVTFRDEDQDTINNL